MVDSAIIINDMASYLLKSKTCFGFFFYHEHISVHDIQSCSKLYIYMILKYPLMTASIQFFIIITSILTFAYQGKCLLLKGSITCRV